jgi:hypothetical protein
LEEPSGGDLAVDFIIFYRSCKICTGAFLEEPSKLWGSYSFQQHTLNWWQEVTARSGAKDEDRHPPLCQACREAELDADKELRNLTFTAIIPAYYEAMACQIKIF